MHVAFVSDLVSPYVSEPDVLHPGIGGGGGNGGSVGKRPARLQWHRGGFHVLTSTEDVLGSVTCPAFFPQSAQQV